MPKRKRARGNLGKRLTTGQLGLWESMMREPGVQPDIYEGVIADVDASGRQIVPRDRDEEGEAHVATN